MATATTPADLMAMAEQTTGLPLRGLDVDQLRELHETFLPEYYTNADHREKARALARAIAYEDRKSGLAHTRKLADIPDPMHQIVVNHAYARGVYRFKLNTAQPTPEPVIETAEKLAAYLIEEGKIGSWIRRQCGGPVTIPPHVTVRNSWDTGESALQWFSVDKDRWCLWVSHDGTPLESQMWTGSRWVVAQEIKERFTATL